MAEIWGAVIAGVVAVGGAVAAKDTARKAGHAVTDAQKIAQGTEYEPIDIDQLIAKAHEQAVANATQSLALERSLTPDIAETRSGLAKSVNEQLALGGKLPPDVINQVTQAARVTGGNTGTLGGSSVPLTAGLLGLSSLDLLNKRQNAASNLVNANPLPVAGLDPGTVAGFEAQNAATENQFNLAKAGINTNLVGAQNQALAAEGGVNANIFASLLGLLTKNQGTGTDTGSILDKILKANQGNQNPATNPTAAPATGFGGGLQ